MENEEKEIVPTIYVDQRSRIFFIILLFLVFFSVGATFYRYMIQKDYVIFTEESQLP